MLDDLCLRGISLGYFQYLNGEDATSPIEDFLRGMSLGYFQYLVGPSTESDNLITTGISLKEGPYTTTGTPGGEGGRGTITSTYYKIIRK